MLPGREILHLAPAQYDRDAARRGRFDSVYCALGVWARASKLAD